MLIYRFAPYFLSGKLHIGHIRTLLLNFSEVKRTGGFIILRIDNEFNIDCLKEIYKLINWLREEFNYCFHAILYLHQNPGAYKNITYYLLKKRLLYASNSTSKLVKFEYLNKKHPICWRFKLRDLKYVDKIMGKKSFEHKHYSDPVCIKNDGFYTYMYASASWDYLYKCNCIIRGTDHMTTTFIHLNIWNILGHNVQLAHIPLVHIGGRKMSKSKPESVINPYEDGYLGKALYMYFNLYGLKYHDKGLYISNISRNDFNLNPKVLLDINWKLLEVLSSLAIQKIIAQRYGKHISIDIIDIKKTKASLLKELLT